MTKTEIAAKLGAALQEVYEIDLRGRRADTTIHIEVTAVREALEGALDRLEEDGP